MIFSPCINCKATDWEYLGSTITIRSAPGAIPSPPGTVIDRYRCRGCDQPMTWAYSFTGQALQPA